MSRSEGLPGATGAAQRFRRASAAAGHAAQGASWPARDTGALRRAQVASATLHILQSHYPERLGRAVCFRAPALFSLTWKARAPW